MASTVKSNLTPSRITNLVRRQIFLPVLSNPGIVDYMKIICVVVCDDCGKSIVNDPNSVSIFVADDDAMGVSLCPQCNEPITVSMSKDTARIIAHKGVKVFSWNLTQEISPENIV